jgi:hypothetical protein
MVHGSVSAYCAHHASCPVAVITARPPRWHARRSGAAVGWLPAEWHPAPAMPVR